MEKLRGKDKSEREKRGIRNRGRNGEEKRKDR